jgi:hypothetical protein
MIACKFSGMTGHAELGPAASLRVRGRALHIDEQPEPAAVHEEAFWCFRNSCYTRFDVCGPVHVRLVPTDGVGEEIVFTEESVWFADGVLHTATQHRLTLDERDDVWIDPSHGSRYREIILSPAS